MDTNRITRDLQRCIERLADECHSGDRELDHRLADEILLDTIDCLANDALMAVAIRTSFEEIEKWYA